MLDPQEAGEEIEDDGDIPMDSDGEEQEEIALQKRQRGILRSPHRQPVLYRAASHKTGPSRNWRRRRCSLRLEFNTKSTSGFTLELRVKSTTPSGEKELGGYCGVEGSHG